MPWYGSRGLLIATATSVGLLMVTVAFWVYQAAMLVADSSPALVATRIPEWVQPAQWCAWSVAAACTFVSLRRASARRNSAALTAVAIACMVLVAASMGWHYGPPVAAD